MAEEGHTIGNHTYSHPDMSKIGDIQSFQTELQKNESLYRDILGSEMPKLCLLYTSQSAIFTRLF